MAIWIGNLFRIRLGNGARFREWVDGMCAPPLVIRRTMVCDAPLMRCPFRPATLLPYPVGT